MCVGNLMLSHSAGMHNNDISIAGICPNKFERAKGSKRFHFASLHCIFSAYLPTHIKFLTEFHRIFFGTTCISFPNFHSHHPPKIRPVRKVRRVRQVSPPINWADTHRRMLKFDNSFAVFAILNYKVYFCKWILAESPNGKRRDSDLYI